MSGAVLLVIAAAGGGTRLGSRRPKPLVEVAGRPLVRYVLDSFEDLQPDVAMIIREDQQGQFHRELDGYPGALRYCYQEHPRGTAYAVWRTFELWPRYDAVVISWADLVWPDRARCEAIMTTYWQQGHAVLVPAVLRDRPYVGLACDDQQRIENVVESREHGADARLGVSDLGMFIVGRRAFPHFREFMAVAQLGVGAHTGEKSFLPFLGYLHQQGEPARALMLSAITDIAINSRSELENYLSAQEVTR